MEEAKTQLHIPACLLPPGSVEGQWLVVQIADGESLSAELDPAKTEEVKERISRKRALLLERMARRR